MWLYRLKIKPQNSIRYFSEICYNDIYDDVEKNAEPFIGDCSSQTAGFNPCKQSVAHLSSFFSNELLSLMTHCPI